MPTTTSWVTFLVASLLFIQVPGPSLLFTIGRALTVGRRDALLSVVGNGLGLLAQVGLVAVGLGALVAASSTAYLAVKVLGAGYVVWLGVQAIRHRADARLALATASDGVAERSRPARALRIGATVGITNPKTLVFFTAFLPQFVDAGAPQAPQLLLLGVVFAVLAIASDSVWALAAGSARAWFSARPRRLDHLSSAGGAMMVGLGVAMVARD